MQNFTLPLALELDPASTMDTLESVLATARRGGLQLSSLMVNETSVQLLVAASEAERLDLFRARLDNLIGLVIIDQKVARMHVA